MISRRGIISLAFICLICFFLPWVQVSCGADRERLNGMDLAREGHTTLWLIPLLMLAVLFLGLARAWRDRRETLALVTMVAGVVSAYLMNRERVKAEDASGLIAVGLTGWFWLGLGSALGLVVFAALTFLKRPRTG